MKRRRKVLAVCVAIVLVAVSLLVYGAATAVRNRLRLVATVQSLKDIAMASVVYQNDHGGTLPMDVERLPVPADTWDDLSTGERFLPCRPASGAPQEPEMLALQSRRVRISPLLWGDTRRYAAFSDGTVRDVEGGRSQQAAPADVEDAAAEP